MGLAGRLASYRRGCDAVISHDNGRSWDVDRMYVLTAYGNYKNAGALIRWKP